MKDSMKYWREDAEANKWVMPAAPFWKRLPIVRHLRAISHSIGVSRHNALVRSIGMIPSGYDRWVLFGIWHGMERKP